MSRRVLRGSAGVLAAVATVAAAALSVGGPARGAPDEPRILPARIETDRVLSGTWRLERDLEVAKGATLRLTAGTRIVAADTDAGASGLTPHLCEILVSGRIAVDGTAEDPVVLEGDPASRWPQPWSGIVLRSARDRAPDSTFVHARFRGATEAVAVADGFPRLERCAFDSCRLGVAAGRIWDSGQRVADDAVRPRPEIVECLFVRCATGLFVESGAAPSAVRCSFVGNQCAVGNYRRSARTYPIQGLGARADRCWFSRNEVGVQGSSVVENSVFTENGAVYRTTAFHSVFSQDTDWIAWRRNAFHANAVVTDGEADLGADNFHVDPGFARTPQVPDRFEDLRVPVPDLEPARDSLLRGAATDGGDCGPAGRAPEGRRRQVWKSAQRALGAALVLGPPERLDAKRLPKSAPSNAGEFAGDAWWVVVDADAGGGIVRSDVPFSDRAEVLPVAWVWAADAARPPAEIELDVDGQVLAWRGGSPLPFPARELRSGSRGVRTPLDPAGPPGVVVWWRTDEIHARLGAAIHGAGRAEVGCAPPDAGPEPLAAEAIRFGARQVGIRFGAPYHWGDLRRSGVIRVRTADGRYLDAVQLSPHVTDGKGTVRFGLPEGIPKAGARFVVDGLTDPWGRTFPGQPLEVSAEP